MTNLSRPILIHCCRDGTITYRTRQERVFNSVALPVFSVNSEEEAKALQVRFCSRQHKEHPKLKGKPWYVLPNFGGEVDDLAGVTARFSEWYAKREALGV